MRLPPIATLAALIAMGGCGPVNNGLESVHQPVVQRTDYAFDLRAADFLEAGSPSAARINQWFEQADLRFNDRLSIDAGTAPAIGEMFARIAVRRGIVVSFQMEPTVTVPGAIRLVMSRASASVPGCPDWRRASQPEFQASTMSNFGCAVNTNLAAMVADPNDLVEGRAADGSDPYASAKAVSAWRTKPLSGTGALENASSKGGGNQ